MFAPAPSLRPAERLMVIHRKTALLLARPVRGRGGFQSLLRRIQAGLTFAAPDIERQPSGLAGGDMWDGDMVTVNIEDIDLLIRLTSGGRLRAHPGGFQRRIMAFVVDILLNETACPEPPRGQLRLPWHDTPAARARKDLRVITGGRL